MIRVKWMRWVEDDCDYVDSPIMQIPAIPQIGDTISVEGIGEVAGQWFRVEDVMWTFGNPAVESGVLYSEEPPASSTQVVVVLEN